MAANLKGKIAIVTGSSRGIGRAIAIKLGRTGAVVNVNYVANETAANEVVRTIKDKGGQAFAVQADLGCLENIENLFQRTLETHGKIDILVNNAGIAIYKPIMDFSEEEYDRSFDLNVKGLFFACRQAARHMADNGRIINISSTITKFMLPRYGVYAATKGAVEQLTKVLAKELGHRNITVNAVSPGPTDTELFREGKTDTQINEFAQMAALGRIGRPEDIADVVAMLVGDGGRWITGQTIFANGGFAA